MAWWWFKEKRRGRNRDGPRSSGKPRSLEDGVQELARKAEYWSVQGREMGLPGRRSRLAWPGHRVLHGQWWMVGGLGR